MSEREPRYGTPLHQYAMSTNGAGYSTCRLCNAVWQKEEWHRRGCRLRSLDDAERELREINTPGAYQGGRNE
jgi:hypothetical protein